jgi:hypothetical protein
MTSESASRPLVDFCISNDNLIKGIILCVKCEQVLNESMYVFIETSLEVQLQRKWNYEINLHSQPLNSSILKNLCQVKQETHMRNKKLNINLVPHLWLDLNQERTDQVLLISVGYLWKQLDHRKNVFKNESMEDMK